jgi:hypothetical protein
VAVADFCLFGRPKQQLSEKTLDDEENVLETVTEILSELPKGEAKSAFVQWKKDNSGWQTIVKSSIRISEMPSYFDIVLFDS